ncbi:MAG: ferritin-like domain-containing protein [Myxococcaceae bacterium]|nr:MAG: ferritin-like domain-containing protein [Myxococcaceae bacterium]
MTRDKRNVFAPHPLLRQTVARLLFAAPVVSAIACSGEEPGGCIPYDAYEGRYDTRDRLPDGGPPTSADCMLVCQRVGAHRCQASPPPTMPTDGGKPLEPHTSCYFDVAAGCTGDGRRPEGLQATRAEARCALGTHFARMAWLEAASVPAFLRLAEELKAHGAPRELIRAARRSAGEEVRHARAASVLARRHGATVPEVEVAPFSARSLEALLVENAKEGCVGETHGALVAGWQARTARDARVREALSRIAEEELRHAELSWAVDAWATGRLTPEARQRVREARLAAFNELEHRVASEEPEAMLVQQAGLPSRDAALHLLRGLQVLIA